MATFRMPTRAPNSAHRGITVTRIGNWGKLLGLPRKMGAFMGKANALFYAEAQMAQQRIRRRIEAQAYGWVPLSERWLEEKVREGQDSRTLIGWGDFLDAIRVLPAGPGAWMVGIPKNATNREGRSIVMIGLVHEYGDSKGKYDVPARPFWEQEYAESREKLLAGLMLLGKQMIA